MSKAAVEEAESEEEARYDKKMAESALEDEPSGEGKPPKMARNPRQPSRSEVVNHRLCHIPYRNWCKICAGALGR